MSRRPSDTGTAPPLVDVTDLEVAYGDLTVLEDVSLEIDRGEFVGLVGPNGAGKTTLLRALNGVLSPVDGHVAIDGTPIESLSSRASSQLVSVVPQDTSLSFSFDIRSIVEMGRHPYRSRFAPPAAEDQEQVDRALERTRTARFADRPIDEISGGERQRVLFARAIAQDAPLMLLDEPTASLDISHQIETLELASELIDDGRAIVAAIHDLELAARYCDRLLLLADGTVHADGTPETVLTSDRLAQAFDANAAVTTNPLTGTASVTTFSRETEAKDGADDAGTATLEDRHVHVVGTGSTAATVLARLESTPARVSVGPAPAGGVVAEYADRRALECVTTEPFAPLESFPRERVLEYCRRADAVILVDVSLTAGNQLLFEGLRGIGPTVVVETRPLGERNFASDGAAGTYRTIRESSVRASPRTVVGALEDAIGRALEDATGNDTTAPPASDTGETEPDGSGRTALEEHEDGSTRSLDTRSDD